MSEANKLTTNQLLIYDLIIIGVGPAGLAASIYASRYKLNNLVIGKQLGGELALAHKIDNYPGFMGISGVDLTQNWKEQVEKLGAKILLQEVNKIEQSEKSQEQNNSPRGEAGNAKFKIIVNTRETYYSRALIVATGSERRRLNIPGEKEYLGKGVSYCVTCDAPFFKDKTVVIVGGANAAVSGAVHLNDFASKIYLVYRGEELKAEPAWVEEWQKIEKKGKGKTIFNTNVQEILGNGRVVTGVKLDQAFEAKEELKTDGVFVEIGGVPGTALVQNQGVKLDETGHVLVDEWMQTNIPGLFCAGDMTQLSAQFKQATLAISQGALAAAGVYKYLKKQTAPPQRGV
jgi:thioredoxin reductase (NADPH)